MPIRFRDRPSKDSSRIFYYQVDRTLKPKEMLRELGQIEIGLGTLVATNERITGAIEPSIYELSIYLTEII
ncbi:MULTISPECIES: hypothetical protein [unclassified Nostoc]|uniref:hypothetical protein n=1 Tax=unclassified Nostoc TaxID=2593658 RepID=UPI002AD43E07|nr:hypothetical protein [Nostoc sp. DedQUE03]MDZ7975945.1 hypothetical protein [Nostoc sp. DedQUE03]MDZ8044780.1 hypothetical protein [Nostoc sp. DedQUE02]